MLKEEWQKIFFWVFLKRDTLTLSFLPFKVGGTTSFTLFRGRGLKNVSDPRFSHFLDPLSTINNWPLSSKIKHTSSYLQ